MDFSKEQRSSLVREQWSNKASWRVLSSMHTRRGCISIPKHLCQLGICDGNKGFWKSLMAFSLFEYLARVTKYSLGQKWPWTGKSYDIWHSQQPHIAVGFLKNCKIQLNVSIDILWEVCSRQEVVCGCTMKFWTFMCWPPESKIRLLWQQMKVRKCIHEK